MKISDLVTMAWTISESKGFHNDPSVTFGDRIALIHTEVSEAMEAYRSGGLEGVKSNLPRASKTEKPEGVPSELADIVIRVADMCGVYGIDLEAAIKEKLEYNKTRPYMHGGKRL